MWEAWFSIDALQLALAQSKTKIASAKGSVWSVVAGPATALIATAERIGWKILSATMAKYDLQHQWNFAADSPAAIGNAVSQSVRRWRLNKILKLVPAAAPSPSDFLSPGSPMQLFEFARTIKAMIAGRGPGKKAETEWDPTWAASLASAINGGQWPQVRMCKVKK